MKSKIMMAAMLAVSSSLVAAQDLPTSISGKISTEEKSTKHTVLIELDTPSVGEYTLNYAQKNGRLPSVTQQREHAKAISQEQKKIKRTIERVAEVVHISDMRMGVNGLKIMTDAESLDAINNVSGVKGIRPVTRHGKNGVPLDTAFSEKLETYIPTDEAADLDSSESELKHQNRIVDLTEYSGEGIKIAIIDDGIDYTHVSLGGSGRVADFENNDPSIIEPGTFPTEKVIGGIDLAGVKYDSNIDEFSVPEPDPDPLSTYGHGTWVASIAAGTGVLGTGLSEALAKDAKLIAIKVFGDEGASTDITADGIEAALDPNGDGSFDDRADVISVSIGEYGGLAKKGSDYHRVMKMATELGVVVVSSVGNSGDVAYNAEVPGIYDDVISVGSHSAIEENPESSFHLIATAGGREFKIPADYKGSDAFSLDNLAQTSAELTSFTPDIHCQPGETQAGKILFIESEELDLRCGWVERVRESRYVEPLEPAGVILYGPRYDNLDGRTRPNSRFEGFPSASVDREGYLYLQRLLDRYGNVTITFDPTSEGLDYSLDEVVDYFSSRGPVRRSSALKPEVVARGSSVYIASNGSGNEVEIADGTSFSSPYIAGLAATIKQRIPDASAAEIKNIILNNTRPSWIGGVSDSELGYPLSAQGVGIADAEAALSATAIVEPAVISLGHRNPSRKRVVQRQITVKNFLPTEQVFTITRQANQTVPGVVIKHPESVTVESYGEASVTVRFRINPKKVDSDTHHFGLNELDGWFVFASAEQNYRVGYHAVIDYASKVAVDHAAQDTAVMSNLGMIQGEGHLYDQIPFELYYNFRETIPKVEQVGYRSIEFNGEEHIEVLLSLAKPISNPLMYYIEIVNENSPEEDGELVYTVGNLYSFTRDYKMDELSLFTFNPNGRSRKYRPVDALAEADFNQSWIRFSMPRYGDAGLERFLSDEGTLNLALQFGLLQLDGFLEEPFSYSNVVEYDAVVFGIEIDWLNENPVENRDFNIGREEVTSIIEGEFNPWLWLFPNNPVANQTIVVGE